MDTTPLLLLISFIVVSWFSMGYIAYKAIISYFTRKWASLCFSLPEDGLVYREGSIDRHRALAIQGFFLGPIGLLMSVVMSDWLKHGISRPTVEELRSMAQDHWDKFDEELRQKARLN